MEQHPIPQQISSYQFKLVGDMTLPQFLKAAGGIVLALMIMSSGLVFFIKWPLVAVFGLGGLALAFLPFEDRPLETWVISFVRSVYSPTIFLWKKRANQNWLDIDMNKSILPEKEEGEGEFEGKDEERVGEYMASISIDGVKKAKKRKGAAEPEVTAKMEEVKTDGVKEEKKTTNTTIEVEETAGEAWRGQKANLNLKTEKLGATGKAVFGQIPMPDTPEVPNLLVGMVTDNGGKILEGAIVEIQDHLGNPSRVVKTNALGQFKISTPLADGTYLVIPEKEGLNFDRVNVSLAGQIVPPIKIQAV